jgi:hypothetical protein
MKLSRIVLLVSTMIISQSAFPQRSGSNIHSVDFGNSIYPWTSDLGNAKKSFTLRNGERPASRNQNGLIDEMGVFFQSVTYGDVTGDGFEEAIVFLGLETGGSATPDLVYIYTFQKNRLKLLWLRSAGDRADGGLRTVYAQNGQLVVELNNSIGSRGDCCPTLFTRTRYEWRGGRFHRKRKETLPSSILE